MEVMMEIAETMSMVVMMMMSSGKKAKKKTR